MEYIRLQKYMSDAGVGSRRFCETLIKDGKVLVNGKVAVIGQKVSKNDNVEYKKKLLVIEDKKYFVFNKPYNFSIVKNKDRENLYTYFESSFKCLVPIKYKEAGVLILSNDGNLLNSIKNKRYNQEYQVRVLENVKQDILVKIKKGFLVNGVLVKDLSFEIISKDSNTKSTLVKLNVVKNDKYDIYDIFNVLNLTIKKVKKISCMGISIDDLKPYEYRPLKIHEIKKLNL